jgi:hypothetical protein
MWNLDCETWDIDCLLSVDTWDLEEVFEEISKPLPCNVGCQAAPVVDGTILPRMLSDM